MRKFLKLSLLVVLAVSATVASAADLEFHGYARAGFGVSSEGGNGGCFQLNSGDAKLRLGNECDWVIEPSFSMSFTKLDDKSQWGVSMLPSYYARWDDPRYSSVPGGNRAAEDIPVSYKEFFFYGRDVPQLGGGEIWLGRRYFDRQYLGAINDQFLEAQDGVGAGVMNIKLGGPLLGFSAIYNPWSSSAVVGGVPTGNVDPAAVNDKNLALGAHVSSITTFNKDSNLQFWGHVYLPMQDTKGTATIAKRKTGYSVSATHIAGFGSAGTLTIAARFDSNAYTDQQNGGSGGQQNIRGVVVYGVSFPSARTSLDVVGEYRDRKAVANTDATAPKTQNDWYQVGFRTDTQISGPFRFLLEAGYDASKNKGDDDADKTNHNLVKVTPCLAMSGGNDPWSRPTFRLYYTYASWNKDGSADVLNAWKDSALPSQFADKTSGGTIGLQAEGWW